MSVKERMHHLIEELSDSDLLVAERMMRGLKLPPEESAEPPRPRPTPEEREEATRRLRAIMKGMSTETFLRGKHEDIEREEVRPLPPCAAGEADSSG